MSFLIANLCPPGESFVTLLQFWSDLQDCYKYVVTMLLLLCNNCPHLYSNIYSDSVDIVTMLQLCNNNYNILERTQISNGAGHIIAMGYRIAMGKAID